MFKRLFRRLYYNESLPTGLFILTFVVVVVIAVFQVWVIGSGLTSGIKAISGSCGQTYPVESIFSGNWFCPKEAP